MADHQDTPTESGTLAVGAGRASFPLAEVLAVVWLAGFGATVAYGQGADVALGDGPFSLVISVLLVALPLGLLWAAVVTLRSVRALRQEAARLHAVVEALRKAVATQQQAQAGGELKPSVEKKLDEIVAAQRQTESVLATFTSRRDPALSVASADRKAVLAVPRPAPPDEQPTLALGTPADDLRPPLSVPDFIRALHFPDGPEDQEGFRALRLALGDRNVAKLIRAAQDVLTLLSQEGIYMDDLVPDRARPEIWRKFAAGERGRAVAALGGVRDRSSLALTTGRMREDPVFRDAGHHFLRTFDRVFVEFEKNATDSELAELADTRTARAFMLFGRVTGTFD